MNPFQRATQVRPAGYRCAVSPSAPESPLAGLPWTIPALGVTYWIGLGVIAVLLIWEHSLVRPEDLSKVNAAFFTANAIIGAVLLVAVGADVWS